MRRDETRRDETRRDETRKATRFRLVGVAHAARLQIPHRRVCVVSLRLVVFFVSGVGKGACIGRIFCRSAKAAFDKSANRRLSWVQPGNAGTAITTRPNQMVFFVFCVDRSSYSARLVSWSSMRREQSNAKVFVMDGTIRRLNVVKGMSLAMAMVVWRGKGSQRKCRVFWMKNCSPTSNARLRCNLGPRVSRCRQRGRGGGAGALGRARAFVVLPAGLLNAALPWPEKGYPLGCWCAVNTHSFLGLSSLKYRGFIFIVHCRVCCL